MRFLNFYESNDNTRTLPFKLEDMRITEDGKVELVITKNNLREMVNKNILKLSKEGKEFSMDEAICHLKELEEAKRTDPKNKKNIDPATSFADPETGVITNFEVALGNAKIGGDTVLLNMSTAKECMSAIIGMCELGANGQCYALKFEKQWKGSEKKNIRHQKQWACLTPEAIAQGLVNINSKIKKLQYVRVNEAGEFRNLPSDPKLTAKVPDAKKVELAGVDDIAKLQKVGDALERLKSPLILYTYTHRSDLNDKLGNLGKNICVNGSGWMIDNAFIPLDLEDFIAIYDKIEKHQLKEFNGEPVKLGVTCKGDCRVCHYCKKKEGKHIFLPIHGAGTAYQMKVEQLLNSIVDNPEYEKILSSNVDVKEKAKKVINILSNEDQKFLSKLIPLPADRIDMFKKLITGALNAEKAVDIIMNYIEARSNTDTANVSGQQSREGLIASIDSLTGDFKTNIDNAIKLGQSTSQNKWEKLLKALNRVISVAEKGEPPKISKLLANKLISKTKGQ